MQSPIRQNPKKNQKLFQFFKNVLIFASLKTTIMNSNEAQFSWRWLNYRFKQ